MDFHLGRDTFCVLSQLPYDVILGMDFMCDFHVILDSKQRRLSFAADEINMCELGLGECEVALRPMQWKVFLAADQCVPGGQTKMLRVVTEKGMDLSTEIALFTASPSAILPHLVYVWDGLVPHCERQQKIGFETQCLIPVSNLSRQTWYISGPIPVGHISLSDISEKEIDSAQTYPHDTNVRQSCMSREVEEDPLFSNDDFLSYDAAGIQPIEPDIQMGASATEIKESLAHVYARLSDLPASEERQQLRRQANRLEERVELADSIRVCSVA